MEFGGDTLRRRFRTIRRGIQNGPVVESAAEREHFLGRVAEIVQLQRIHGRPERTTSVVSGDDRLLLGHESFRIRLQDHDVLEGGHRLRDDAIGRADDGRREILMIHVVDDLLIDDLRGGAEHGRLLERARRLDFAEHRGDDFFSLIHGQRRYDYVLFRRTIERLRTRQYETDGADAVDGGDRINGVRRNGGGDSRRSRVSVVGIRIGIGVRGGGHLHADRRVHGRGGGTASTVPVIATFPTIAILPIRGPRPAAAVDAGGAAGGPAGGAAGSRREAAAVTGCPAGGAVGSARGAPPALEAELLEAAGRQCAQRADHLVLGVCVEVHVEAHALVQVERAHGTLYLRVHGVHGVHGVGGHRSPTVEDN